MTSLNPILAIGCHGFYELNEDKTEIPTFELPFDIIKINAAPLGCISYLREQTKEIKIIKLKLKRKEQKELLSNLNNNIKQ